MRVLVTGATGFIGSALCNRLRQRGDSVLALTRRPSTPGEVGVDLAAGRLDSSRVPGGTLEGVDAAVHLAGAPIIGRWTARREEEIRSSRIAVGDLLARSLAALDRRPAVLITGSAVGIYGDRGDEWLDESSEPGRGFLAEVCKAWEASTAPAAAAGIRTAAVRTGIVLGRGGALGPQVPLFRLGLGGRLGSGRQWVSWIALEDEVAAIMRILDDPELTGPFNLSAPNPVRNGELTAELARALHRPAALAVPPAALRLALGRGPADEMLLASQRVRPARLIEAGFEFRHPELASALAAALR
ncbi:MAG TPA: TIGR01777 family oxidoreductase [Acidimicrobiales bacterium]|nr:TIGR01777 family oxidoreductase [Acidimicrobiales bacterium]